MCVFEMHCCRVAWLPESESWDFSEAALSNLLASPCNQRLTSDSPLELLELLGCEGQKLSVLPSVYEGGRFFFTSFDVLASREGVFASFLIASRL